MPSPFQKVGESGDDRWVDDMAEAMLIVKALDAGGVLMVRPEKLAEMVERSKRWFPNGMHAHWEASREDGYKLELVDRSKCDKEGTHERDGNNQRWGSADDDNIVTRLNEDGSPAPGPLSPREVAQLSHAQHVLLCVALSRLGDITIEVTQEEYEAATRANIGGLGALMISRKGDVYSAALVNNAKVGQA